MLLFPANQKPELLHMDVLETALRKVSNPTGAEPRNRYELGRHRRLDGHLLGRGGRGFAH